MKHCTATGRRLLGSGFCLGLLLAARAEEGVALREAGDRLRVEINGELFTEYHYQNVSRPFLYPVLGPGGVSLTRHWPMREAPGEDRDHPHHRSLWWAHGDVNGVDFWSESERAGRIVHEAFLERAGGRDAAVLRTRNKLVTRDGQMIGRVEFRLIFHRGDDTARWLDWETTVLATAEELRLGDTKEGTMAIRLNETMRLRPNKHHAGKPTGHILNSAGVRDGDTWGKRAAWVDYTGLAEGRLHLIRTLHPDPRRAHRLRPSRQPAASHLVACARLRAVRRQSVRGA